MEFVKKNFPTVLVVGATVVLAGVAIFTATRLYQLRDGGATPADPGVSEAQEAPIAVRPSSGNWDLPETFIVTNVSDAPVELAWQIDCWNEELCEDNFGTLTLEPGASFEEGLGLICSQWQLDLNYTDVNLAESDIWDWSKESLIGSDCEVELAGADTPDSTADDQTGTSIEDPLSNSNLDETADTGTNELEDQSLEITQRNTTTSTNGYQATQCQPLTFSVTLADSGTGGGGIEATPEPTLEPTPEPAVEPTATPTATPVDSDSTASATPTETDDETLADAGFSLPTLFGIALGGVLLAAAFLLAI